MKRTVVVYRSKYGYTEKYAKWMAAALSCDLFERREIKAGDLDSYDTIVYGGGLYAGGVSGIDIITKKFDTLCGKNIILFTCGLANTTDKENVDNIRKGLNKVLTLEMKKQIKIFHLRGGIDYSRLGIVHKLMMAMLRKILQSKDYDSLRDEDRDLLDTYGKAVDFSDESSILPLVAFVQGL